MAKTTIQIDEEIRDRLASRCKQKGETYNIIIQRLLDETKGE